MKKTKDREIKLIFAAVILLFGAFLVLPVFRLLGKSFLGDSGVTTAFYREVFGSKGFLTALGNSFLVASLAALCTTAIAFLLAYTIHYTNVPKKLKSFSVQQRYFLCCCPPLLMVLRFCIPLEKKGF